MAIQARATLLTLRTKNLSLGYGYDVIITKQNSNKKPPKYYLVCRYNRKRCDLYETKDLIDDVKNFSFTENMTQFFIGNIVVKVGWQNGVGFNPSVRCKFR